MYRTATTSSAVRHRRPTREGPDLLFANQRLALGLQLLRRVLESLPNRVVRLIPVVTKGRKPSKVAVFILSLSFIELSIFPPLEDRSYLIRHCRHLLNYANTMPKDGKYTTGEYAVAAVWLSVGSRGASSGSWSLPSAILQQSFSNPSASISPIKLP